MNEFSITPFRGLHLLLLLLTAAAVLLIFLLLRGKPEARRSRYLIGVCFFNLALFAGYKLSLSMDAAYIRAYYPNGFNIFNELPAPLILAGYMYAVCALSRLTRGAEEVSFS